MNSRAIQHQPDTALDHGNEVRVQRTIMRDLLWQGLVPLDDVLAHPALATTPMYKVLGWLPGVGHSRLTLACRYAEILPSYVPRNCGGLTGRQVRALAHWWALRKPVAGADGRSNSRWIHRERNGR